MNVIDEMVLAYSRATLGLSTCSADTIRRGLEASLGSQAAAPDGFQQEVDRWLIACFGEEIARDRTERNHRFIEEALELVQAGGCTASEAHQLVDYVFGRPIGEMHQEVGGVMNTLAALCLAYDLDMAECGDIEIARCWTKVEKIRAKQAAKPKHSPLPEHTAPPAPLPAHEAAPVGQVLSEAEMPAGFDRKFGKVIWFGEPPAGLLYTSPADSQERVKALEEMLKSVRQWMIPGMNWTDEIGVALKSGVDVLLATKDGDTEHGR